jgi:ankyrin repeat protein
MSGMIRALLYQILNRRPSLVHEISLMRTYETLKENKNQNSSNIEWPLDVLRNVFLSLRDTRDSSVFYLVIDSLDESRYKPLDAFQTEAGAVNTASDVIDLLVEVVSHSRKFKVFLTSRPETFSKQSHRLPFPRISLESIEDGKYVLEDIKSHASSQVSKYLPGYGREVEMLIEKLTDRSEGVFLWVSLVIARLKDKYQRGEANPSNLVEFIDLLPKGMTELYRDMLRRLEIEDHEPRRIMLQWILFAERPLTMEELRIAVTMNRYPGKYSSETEIEKSVTMEMFKRQIESYCGGLVAFVSQKATEGTPPYQYQGIEPTGNVTVVQLVHKSAKDFLLENPKDWFLVEDVVSRNWEPAHLQLAETCLAYLCFDAFLDGPTTDTDWQNVSELYHDRLQRHHLLKYAASYWPKHLNMAPESIKAAWQPLHEFIKNTQKASLSFQVAAIELHLGIFGGTELLHLISELGHEAVMKLLLEEGDADLEFEDNDSWTPLSRAARNGNEAIVKLLIEKGANLESKGKYGYTPLWRAAYDEHEAVVRLLVEKGANLECEDIYGLTLLSQAAGDEHETVVKLLVKNGANLESKDSYGWTPLSRAANSGHEAIVKLLVEKGATLESKTNGGWTPLSLAASKGHEAIVKLLVEKGANLESEDNDSWTPLSRAARDGHGAVAKLLVERGANLESKGWYGYTPLLRAACDGQEAVVKLLVEKGANLESKDIYGWTPLSRAANSGHEAIVKLLVEKGANLESEDSEGWTPLSRAARDGHGAIVKLLVEIGANPESRNGSSSQESVVKLPKSKTQGK